MARAVLSSVLRAHDVSHVLPPLRALIAVTIALDFARAIESEQSRVLAELVGLRALDRVLDVVTEADLLEFESPEYYDRVRRAQYQGQFRALQTVNGLLGLAGGLVGAAGILRQFPEPPPAGLRHDARPRVLRRLRPLDRPVAADRPGAGVLP